MPGGVSILEMLWRDLDRTVDQIMDQDDTGKGKSHEGQRLAGVATGLATAIAYFERPFSPDVKEVKKQAMRHYQGRNKSAQD